MAAEAEKRVTWNGPTNSCSNSVQKVAAGRRLVASQVFAAGLAEF